MNLIDLMTAKGSPGGENVKVFTDKQGRKIRKRSYVLGEDTTLPNSIMQLFQSSGDTPDMRGLPAEAIMQMGAQNRQDQQYAANSLMNLFQQNRQFQASRDDEQYRRMDIDRKFEELLRQGAFGRKIQTMQFELDQAKQAALEQYRNQTLGLDQQRLGLEQQRVGLEGGRLALQQAVQGLQMQNLQEEMSRNKFMDDLMKYGIGAQPAPYDERQIGMPQRQRLDAMLDEMTKMNAQRQLRIQALNAMKPTGGAGKEPDISKTIFDRLKQSHGLTTFPSPDVAAKLNKEADVAYNIYLDKLAGTANPTKVQSDKALHESINEARERVALMALLPEIPGDMTPQEKRERMIQLIKKRFANIHSDDQAEEILRRHELR